MILIRLPMPPSVNALYYNSTKKGRRGRALTQKYRDWLDQADKWMLLQKRNEPHRQGKVEGRCEIFIRIPATRGDPSNYIKAAQDYLVSREITGDDKHHHDVRIAVSSEVDCCEIIITPTPQGP